jgi:ABC-type antimicrobial peptide transport system permease subunit
MFLSNPKIFYQAVMFGVISVLLGLILSLIFGFLKPELPEDCDNWDKYYVMEVIMFLTGFILRYLMTNESICKYMYEPN